MQNNAKTRIIFCFPYKGVGGVSLLFLRIAEELVLQKGDSTEIYLVDYIDGFMAKNKTRPQVQLIEYTDNKDVKLPENSILVFQSMSPWSIFPSLRFSKNNRLFFWTCHPFNLVPTFPGLRMYMYNNVFL